MVHVDGMVYGKSTVSGVVCWRYGTGKTPYVVWYVVGDIVRWYGVVDVYG